MVNDIIDGISNALYEAFPDHAIYSETIKQGLKEPCFFILPLNPSESPLLGVRAVRTIPLDVHYFPPEKGPKNKTMGIVASKLYGVLKRVKLLNGDLLNGFDLNYEIVDDVLHFFVTFKVVVKYPVDAVDNIESLEIQQGVKQ